MLKKLALLLAAVPLLAFSAFAQAQITPPVGLNAHRQGGIYYAPAYATWQATIISGNSASGSASIIVASNTNGVSLADGAVLPFTTVFNTSTPIYIQDANAETVTPSAVSVGACPAGNLGVGGSSICATVTATFANTHGQSAIVISGDSGIEEAFTDAGANGGGLVYWTVDTGTVTLTTTGLTTTTTTKVPTNFLSEGASAKVETTITTSANWAVGISGSTAAFCTANSTLTAGTSCIANMNSPASVGTSQALTAVLFTMGTSDPGAGAIKARVWGFSAIQSTN